MASSSAVRIWMVSAPGRQGVRRSIEILTDELDRSKMPGYISRYDDLDGEFDDPNAVVDPNAAHAPATHGAEPPLRRGPLRGHTQHSRGNQSVLRGPHVPPRTHKETPEGITSERGEPSQQGFGNGL